RQEPDRLARLVADVDAAAAFVSLASRSAAFSVASSDASSAMLLPEAAIHARAAATSPPRLACRIRYARSLASPWQSLIVPEVAPRAYPSISMSLRSRMAVTCSGGHPTRSPIRMPMRCSMKFEPWSAKRCVIESQICRRLQSSSDGPEQYLDAT